MTAKVNTEHEPKSYISKQHMRTPDIRAKCLTSSHASVLLANMSFLRRFSGMHAKRPQPRSVVVDGANLANGFNFQRGKRIELVESCRTHHPKSS